MAVTGTPGGTLSLAIGLKNTLSGDRSGEESTSLATQLLQFLSSGSTEPVISGWFQGTAVCAAGTWELAHATDPLQSMGDATYCTGGAPNAGVSKLKMLFIMNTHATATITVARTASVGLPIFDTAGDSVTIKAGGFRLFYDPSGLTAALTNDTNDALTISVSAGSPTAVVIAAYGP